MTITAPTAGQEILDSWTTALTAVANGFVNSQKITASGALTLSNVEQDVPGMTVTFALVGANGFADLTVNMDFTVGTASSATQLVARINVDTVSNTTEPINNNATALGSQTTARTFHLPLAAGSHTIKVVGLKSAAAAGTANATSTMILTVFDLA